MIDRDGSRTTRISDSRGRITRDVTPEGQDTRYAYDEYDRVTAVSISAFETDPKKRYAATQARRNAADAEADGISMVMLSSPTSGHTTGRDWEAPGSRLYTKLFAKGSLLPSEYV